jgi:hypothetical protein
MPPQAEQPGLKGSRIRYAAILDVAQVRERELPGLLDVLRSGSASSTALLALGSAITVSNAGHLREHKLIDVDLFARAVGPLEDKGQAVIGQAVAGAQALPELAARIAG